MSCRWKKRQLVDAFGPDHRFQQDLSSLDQRETITKEKLESKFSPVLKWNTTARHDNESRQELGYVRRRRPLYQSRKSHLWSTDDKTCNWYLKKKTSQIPCQRLLRPAKKIKTGSNNKLVFIKNVNGLTCPAEKIAWNKKPEHDRWAKPSCRFQK